MSARKPGKLTYRGGTGPPRERERESVLFQNSDIVYNNSLLQTEKMLLLAIQEPLQLILAIQEPLKLLLAIQEPQNLLLAIQEPQNLLLAIQEPLEVGYCRMF